MVLLTSYFSIREVDLFALMSMQNPALSTAEIKRVVEGSGFRLSNATEPTVGQKLHMKNEEPVRVRHNPSPFYKGMRVEALKVKVQLLAPPFHIHIRIYNNLLI